MPILAEEPSIYPTDLLDEFASHPADGRRWWAIYAKSRQEKALARQLLAQGVPFYLPLVSKRQFISGRPYCSHLPLFPGYLFSYSTEEHRVCALTTKRVSRILPVVDEPQLLYDLRHVRQLIEADVPLTVERLLDAGERVRVKHGSFGGLEGIIIRRNRKTRLLIAVNYLQQGVSIEIDDVMVEPI